MLDNPILLAATYMAMASALSVGVAKISTGIGPRLRHFFAGTAPLAVLFASLLSGKDTVILHWQDILAGFGLAALGIATSILVGKFIPNINHKDGHLT